MSFEEMIAALMSAQDGGEPASPGIYDDLTNSYRSLEESSAAKVAQMEEMLSAQAAEIANLKAKNWDLLMSQPSTEETESQAPEDNPTDSEPSIDGLFSEE